MNKISGPILDRIDLHIEVNSVKFENLSSSTNSDSKSIKQRVNIARAIQLERYKNYGIYSNSELSSNLIEKYCKIDEGCKKILRNAFNKLGLSVRAYTKILKVARTIADLNAEECITPIDIAEAIQYRNLDRKD